jgi:hypothetical protein
MDKLIEQIVLKRSINGQQMHEEIFNILSHKGNAAQNYIEIAPHPSQNSYHQVNKQ